MKRKSHPLLYLFLLAACCGVHAQAPQYNPFMDQGRCSFTVPGYPATLPPTVLAPPDQTLTHFYELCKPKKPKKFKKCSAEFFLNYRHRDSLQLSQMWRWFQIKDDVTTGGPTITQISYTTRIATAVGPLGSWRLTMAMDRSDIAFFNDPKAEAGVSVSIIKISTPGVPTPSNKTVTNTNITNDPASASAPASLTTTTTTTTTATTTINPAATLPSASSYTFSADKYSYPLGALDGNSVYDIVITITPSSTTSYDHIFDLIVTTP